MATKTSLQQVIWFNAFFLLFAHLVGLHGVWLALTLQARWQTVLFSFTLLNFTVLSLTAGGHRMWCHKAYKAKLPLKVFYLFWHTMSFQENMYKWVRNHRTHHKYSDTDADPHNSNRGFFFCHIGWLMMKKHKDCIEKGKTIDLSDVEADSTVTFQRKYYNIIGPLLAFVLPTVVPMYYWDESFYVSYSLAMFKFIGSLNVLLTVNSVAHRWGMKPYDKNIKATESRMMAWLTLGEGYHNFHHTFPWDYRGSETSIYGNVSTKFIQAMEKIGQVYDLKRTPDDVVIRRKNRTGDKCTEVLYEHAVKSCM